MTVDRSAFVDDSGETRFAGTIQPGPGTSAGDTLQSTGVDGEAAEWAAGGGSVPVSYLGSYTQGSTLLTASMAAQAFDSPADVLVSTDISISEDGKTFTINTDGFYAINVQSQYHGGDGSTLGRAEYVVTADALDAGDLYSIMGPITVVEYIDGATSTATPETPFTLPPMNFKAGDTFQVKARAVLSAGALSWSGGVIIVRTA